MFESYPEFLWYVFLTLCILVGVVIFICVTLMAYWFLKETYYEHITDIDLQKQVLYYKDDFVDFIKHKGGTFDTNND